MISTIEKITNKKVVDIDSRQLLLIDVGLMKILWKEVTILKYFFGNLIINTLVKIS